MTPTEKNHPVGRPGRWLRDPLLHFLLIGIVLFGGYRWLNPLASRAEQPDQIVLTSDDLRQIALAWMAQGRGKPTRSR